jgi:lipopolysaccharide assembly protein A
VLIAFTAGLAVGVLGMVPRWWRQRKASQQLMAQSKAPSVSIKPEAPVPDLSASRPIIK